MGPDSLQNLASLLPVDPGEGEGDMEGWRDTGGKMVGEVEVSRQKHSLQPPLHLFTPRPLCLPPVWK